MKYAIVCSSRTGNTRMLSEALKNLLPAEECVYAGTPDDAALAADRLYVGFWTDKGSCDDATAEFLSKVGGKEIFLFGTAGFGGEPSYFERILGNAARNIDHSNTIVGSYMCQGKMPMVVRERYEKMLLAPDHAPNLESMIENFDRALSHPDEDDLAQFKKAVL